MKTRYKWDGTCLVPVEFLRGERIHVPTAEAFSCFMETPTAEHTLHSETVSIPIELWRMPVAARLALRRRTTRIQAFSTRGKKGYRTGAQPYR